MSKEVANTPGYWVAQRDPDAIGKSDWCIGVDGAPIDYVAVCSERDARLIAAAKELLEASLKAVEWISETPLAKRTENECCIYSLCTSAILKARGAT